MTANPWDEHIIDSDGARPCHCSRSLADAAVTVLAGMINNHADDSLPGYLSAVAGFVCPAMSMDLSLAGFSRVLEKHSEVNEVMTARVRYERTPSHGWEWEYSEFGNRIVSDWLASGDEEHRSACDSFATAMALATRFVNDDWTAVRKIQESIAPDTAWPITAMIVAETVSVVASLRAN